MELSIPYLELNPLEKIKRPLPIFILQNCVWGFGVFCGLGLGLGFVFNEIGKKIWTCSAGNFVPSRRAVVPSLVFLGSQDWISQVAWIYPRAEPDHVNLLSLSSSALSLAITDLTILFRF